MPKKSYADLVQENRELREKQKAAEAEPAKPLTKIEAAERQEGAHMAAQTDLEKQRAEPHYWITFIQGDDDPVDEVHIGAAGVRYDIRKGERVPLPLSAIKALKLAVIKTKEPVVENGKRFLRHVNRQRFAYSNEGPVSPEDLAAFRKEMEQIRRASEVQELHRERPDGALEQLGEASL